MRKAEMVQRIAQELGCTTAKAEAVAEAILTTIKGCLENNHIPSNLVVASLGPCLWS
jgi:nucleoid DNA-binding protein